MEVVVQEMAGGLQDPQFISDAHEKQVYAEACLAKWNGSRPGFSDWVSPKSVETELGKRYKWIALEDEGKQAGLAMILENQLKFQRERNRQTLFQDTTTGDLALPTIAVLPIIRRVYAQLFDRDFGVIQPMTMPTSNVFWMDFLREADGSNLLSVEYNGFTSGEAQVPAKGKFRLTSAVIKAIKNILGVTWTLESEEDLRAVLGLNGEQELVNAFSNELGRNIMARHLLEISKQSKTGVGVGASLPNPWGSANPAHAIPAPTSGQLSNERKSSIYGVLIAADVDFQRVNEEPSNTIMAGFGLAGLLQQAFTATTSGAPNSQNLSSIGVTSYDTQESRWKIRGTRFLPNNEGFMYTGNPDQLQAGHVYAPYIPLMVMDAVYSGYDATTGNYTNTDEKTRNIRERSAHIVTRPYAFQPISCDPGCVF